MFGSSGFLLSGVLSDPRMQEEIAVMVRADPRVRALAICKSIDGVVAVKHFVEVRPLNQRNGS